MKFSDLSHKQKELLFAGVFLFFCIVTFLLVIIRNNPELNQQGSVMPTSVPVSSNKIISTPTPDIRSAVLSLSQSSPTSFTVNLDSRGKNVTGVQFSLSFDPQLLQNVTVTPGQFLVSPLILANKVTVVDKVNATILYAAANRPDSKPIAGNGVIATISYTVTPGLSSSTIVTFLPQTKVTMQGVGGASILKQSSGITLNLTNKNP